VLAEILIIVGPANGSAVASPGCFQEQAGAVDMGSSKSQCCFPAPVASLQLTRWLNRPQMPSSEKTLAPRKRVLSSRAREALELLASVPHGTTETFMHVNGFSLRMLIGLVRRRLVKVQSERVNTGAKSVKGVRIKITDAGRRALEG
jgi:hypothetical protein